MFELEIFKEIFRTLSQNKLRTFLTGISVAWGIFILMVLLGSGKGLSNGINAAFGKNANYLYIGGGRTAIPFMGFKPGRYIRLETDDCDEIRRQIKEVVYLSPITRLGEGRILSINNKTNDMFNVRMVGVDYPKFAEYSIVSGRLINDMDDLEHRKVIAIGKKIASYFFEDKPAVGEFINIAGISFKIIGVFTDETRDDQWKDRFAIIPFSTGQKVFNIGNTVGTIDLSLENKTLEENKAIVKSIKKLLSVKHKFAPEDSGAVWVGNNMEEYLNFLMILRGIKVFIWLIGVCTIVAGAVGISNIMMIAVDERTKEIGIRKALGAVPLSIIGMVVLESLLITLAFGIFGMACGAGVLDVASRYIPPGHFFKSPEADMATAAVAVLVLMFAGAIASIVPARKAAYIKPVEALREE